MKDRNKRKLIIYALVGVLMLTTVAYAALSTVLNVSGTVVKKGNLWNIYFTNPSNASVVGTATGSSINIQASSLNFQVSLYKPGDKVSYTVDIKNGGTIDAVLNSISLTGLDTAKSNSLNYTVTYSDGSTIKEGDTLNVGANKTLKITVEFDSTATSIPANDVNLTFGVTLIYGQTTSSSSTGTSGITSNNVIAGIYGESIQNGTPTPTSPVEIESVGERTTNYYKASNFSSKDFNVSYDELTSIYTINGTSTVAQNIELSDHLNLDIVSGENVVLTVEIISGNIERNNYYILYSLFDNTGTKYIRNQQSGYLVNPGKQSVTGELFSAEYYKYYVQVGGAGVKFNDVKLRIKIEKASNTSDEYEPYGYKIPITVSNGTDTKTTNIYLKEPLRKIGEYADYLDLTTKKVVRNVKEKVLSSSDKLSITGRGISFTENVDIIKPSSTLTLPLVMCSHYNKSEWTYTMPTAGTKEGVSINSTARLIGFYDSVNTTSLEKFKAFLDSNEVKLNYLLATPTEESVDVPEIPSLTGNVTYDIGTSIKPSKLEYGY